jgi:hypothetical protein
MCIIGIKDHKAEDFTEEILKYCWEKNSDGAGYAYWLPTESLWQVHKGFMKWGDFIEKYKSQNFKKEDTVFVHFRIGTSGYKDGGNCHPFPILDDVDEMRKLEFKTPYMAIHNGVVGNGEKVASDTICYIRDYLFPLMSIWEDKRVHDNIADTILTKGASRWIVTYKETYWKYGTWHKYKDWEFSNLNYAPSTPTYYSGGTSGWNGGGTWYSNSKPYIQKEHLDSWYTKLDEWKELPYGYFSSGVQYGKCGYWQAGTFTSWEDSYNSVKHKYVDRGLLPPAGNPARKDKENSKVSVYDKLMSMTATEILQRYFQTYCTKDGKCLSNFNWKVFSIDKQIVKHHEKKKNKNSGLEKAAKEYNLDKKDVHAALMNTEGDLLIWDGNKVAEKQGADLDDLRTCPHCFGEQIGPTQYTVGDNMCNECGCVFTMSTGVIHMYDLDMFRRFSTKTHGGALNG